MKIKLTSSKNIYGKRVDSGVHLAVGSDIPEWQAQKLIQIGGAVEVAASKDKPKKKKA